ncbi:MAG: nucleoside recognition protein [Bacillota bacterium]|nr:nucleoside recognition protein [Bacillota bacterium]MDW7682629.1 nucleoside recognition protein [Bacillota bacterium]
MFVSYLGEALFKSMTTVFYLLLILVPIMIVMEYANHFQLLEKLTAPLGWLPRLLTMSPKAAFPIVVGLFVGVTYGAAVLIEYARQGSLSKRDMLLCGVFLAINHSIIEDNLIFAALGANLVILFPLRFVAGFIITRGVAYIIDSRSGTEAVEGTETG